jgi:hypothetical protein
MRAFLRAAGALAALALLVVLGGLAFLAARKPRMRPASVERVEPDPARLARGQHLVVHLGCRDCHTPHDAHGQLVPGKDFQGGWEMRGPWGRVVSANITPDPRLFMGQATRTEFIGRFRAFAPMAVPDGAPAARKGHDTAMPWLAMSGMTDADLGAIYDYLKTLPAGGGPVRSFPDDREPPLPPGASPVNATRPEGR